MMHSIHIAKMKSPVGKPTVSAGLSFDTEILPIFGSATEKRATRLLRQHADSWIKSQSSDQFPVGQGLSLTKTHTQNA